MLTGQLLGSDGQGGRQGLHMAPLRIVAENPPEALDASFETGIRKNHRRTQPVTLQGLWCGPLFDSLVLSKSLLLSGRVFSPWLGFSLCWAQKAQGQIWGPGF